MDDDGYPDDDELQAIRDWQRGADIDWRPLMAYVRERWRYADYGDGYWQKHIYSAPNRGYWIRYVLATGGWSGNEDLIMALENNLPFWCECWALSRRGGKYEFEVRLRAKGD